MSDYIPVRLSVFQWLATELLEHWLATGDFALVRSFVSEMPEVERFGLLEFLFYHALDRDDWMLAEHCDSDGGIVVPREQSAFGPVHHVIVSLRDRPDVVGWLIRHGAEIERRGYGNATPLIAAVGHGLSETVRKLLDCGANINATTEVDDNESSLMVAAARGDAELAKLLVDRGADISAQNRWGRNALQIAKSCNHNDVVDVLQKAN